MRKICSCRMGNVSDVKRRWLWGEEMREARFVKQTLLEEDTDTVGGKNTLLHGESLFVVTARDLENVSLVFISKAGAFHFLSNVLIHEWTAEENEMKRFYNKMQQGTTTLNVSMLDKQTISLHR